MQTNTLDPENKPASQQVFLSPRADIRGNADGTDVLLDLPGVSSDGLEITVEDQELTIVGRRKNGLPKGEYFHNEIRPVDYRRVFELAPSIDTARVSADLHDGVLRLHLPIAERVKPRRIAVT